jgi:NitT/TauT family transport system permease protein
MRSDASPAPGPAEGAILPPALAGAALIAVWQIAVWVTKTSIFPGPLAVVRGLFQLARTGVLFRYMADSIRRVATGFAVATVVGVPLGMLAGLYRRVDAALNPVVQALRPISPLAWTPIVIVLFGIGDRATTSLIVVAAIGPILVSTAAATRDVPPIFLDAGRNFGLSPAALLRRVIFPAALPAILTGLRIAFGVSWLVLVAAEMIAVDSGLGYLIVDARNAGKRYDLVVAGMLAIGAIGLAFDIGFQRLSRLRAVRWGFSANDDR